MDLSDSFNGRSSQDGLGRSNEGCTYGAIRDLYATCSNAGKVPYIPRLRIVDGKRLVGRGGDPDKWKVSISDGASVMLGVTGQAVTEMLDSGKLSVGCLFSLTSYGVVKLSEGTRVCFLIEVKCLENDSASGILGLDHCFPWEGGVAPGRGRTKCTADKRVMLPCAENETTKGSDPPRKRWRREY